MHVGEAMGAYLPEGQIEVQDEAGVEGLYLPAAQLTQASRLAWSEGSLESSVMYLAAGQLVQEIEAAIEYVPKEQMSHATLDG